MSKIFIIWVVNQSAQHTMTLCLRSSQFIIHFSWRGEKGFLFSPIEQRTPRLELKTRPKRSSINLGLGARGYQTPTPPRPAQEERERERERLREKHHLRVRAKKRSGKPNRPTSRIPILSRRACLENVKRVKTQLENQFVGWVCGERGAAVRYRRGYDPTPQSQSQMLWPKTKPKNDMAVACQPLQEYFEHDGPTQRGAGSVGKSRSRWWS